MVGFETVINAETRLVRTGGTIKVGVTPKSAFSADMTSLGRGTREDIWKIPLMQPAYCICIGKVGHSTVWKQKGCDELFLKKGSSLS